MSRTIILNQRANKVVRSMTTISSKSVAMLTNLSNKLLKKGEEKKQKSFIQELNEQVQKIPVYASFPRMECHISTQ